MWLMNRVFNSIVRWILTSPLHWLMSKSVMLITFRGRKSGQEFTTPVQFTRDGEEVWVMVGFPEKKNWWRNLIGGAAVKVCIERTWNAGNAVVLRGETDQKEILVGLKQIINKFPFLQKEHGSPDSPELKSAEIVIVKITLD